MIILRHIYRIRGEYDRFSDGQVDRGSIGKSYTPFAHIMFVLAYRSKYKPTKTSASTKQIINAAQILNGDVHNTL